MKKGIEIVDNLNELININNKINDIVQVIIRSHGVGPKTMEVLNNLENIKIIDATCPFVKKSSTNRKPIV